MSVGFNDGVIYPPEMGPQSSPGRTRSLSLSAQLAPLPTRKLHALALLVDFSDNKGTRPAADFQKMLFDPGNPNSMTSYYNTISGGALQVSGDVKGYVRAPKPYNFYTDGQSGTGNNFPKNTPGLLQDALTVFTATNSLAPYDSDGDGFVDGIFLIHAGGGAEAEPNPTKRREMIWSHKWTLPTPFVKNGVSVFAYSTEPEDGNVGVFCHEFGHVLGLPDLYDTSNRSEGVGDWCLMGGGSWGNRGLNPTRMSCWCLNRLGWIKSTNVTSSKTLSLPTLETDPKASYRLWTGGAAGTEYFLIENRQQTGLDKYLPGSGLALWHIDEKQSNNTNPLAYLVGLVQADGLKELELGANRGDAGDLFPGTANVKTVSDTTNPSTRSNDGSASKVKLSGITENSGIIKAKVNV
ncbi:M6 family metalloprotease domain-containing protein [Schlesneria paludicola]|uniref:M6 family metalloprotease domain-containing protein n=1 Tax=Schlesneria paludicola TaxID=360056 RepID=UPI00029AF96D|nr:M6 family metalloprotease domain-containing protein [Schlesneria paludicola]